jgi:hypothetical protein
LKGGDERLGSLLNELKLCRLVIGNEGLKSYYAGDFRQL